MRKLWICILGSWGITGRKWRTFKVGYLDLQTGNNDKIMIFCKWNWLRKVCKWIHHDLQTNTLGVFLEKNTGVQSIWLDESWIRRYDIMNRGSNKSANTNTSKKLEIPFRIVFENISNGFIMSLNLKHNKSLMYTMQCNRNFNILINWSKVITRQIGLPRIICNYTNAQNSKWPTLRDSKPSEMGLKQLKLWNIGS